MAMLTQAVRSLFRAPWFTAAAVATFALGIGMNIAVFSVIDRMLFRPLPYAHRDRLVQIHGMTARSSAAPQAFLPRIITREIAAGARTIDSIAYASVPEPRDGDAFQLASGTFNLLTTIGVRPVVGRDFTADDARGKERALLLSHDTWQARYGGAANVLDTAVRQSNLTMRVVGVLPRDFLLPSTRYPERLDGLIVAFEDFQPQDSDGKGLITAAPVARLRPGFTVEQAQAEIDLLIARLSRDSPILQRMPSEPGSGVTVHSFRTGLIFVFAPYLWLIAVAVWLVLLIACVNLSTLLLARGRSREQEAAVRTALGASFRQLLTASIAETVVLCVASAMVALAVCRVAQTAILAVVPAYFHAFAVSALDMRLVALSLGVAFVAAIAAGMTSVIALRRVNLLSLLQRGGRSASSRLRGGGALLAMESALGIILVAGAAMTVRSFLGLVTASPGFDPANLYHLHVQHGYRDEPPNYPFDRVRAVEEIVRSQPGVIQVGAATQLPVGRFAGLDSAFLKSRGIDGSQFGASSGLFAALGTPILAGREFTEDEVRDDTPVAIVNRMAAAALWPGVPAAEIIGRTVDEAGSSRVVVGVVADIVRVPGEGGTPTVVVPVTTRGARRSSSALMVAVRMAPGTQPDIRPIDAALDARFGSDSVRSDSVLSTMTPFLQRPRFQAALFGALAAIALILCAVGLYAVASFEVSRRRFEMGVRLALGATAQRIRRVVIRDSLRPILVGVIAGTIGAVWAAQFLQTFLIGVDARDPWTLMLVVAVVIAVALIASVVPARRASLVDPVSTLKAQ